MSSSKTSCHHVRQPIVTNDFKGVGPFILASFEMENVA